MFRNTVSAIRLGAFLSISAGAQSIDTAPYADFVGVHNVTSTTPSRACAVTVNNIHGILQHVASNEVVSDKWVPIVMARVKAIEAAGGNGFFDYQIPRAVIALNQGFGRLIRSTSDRGVLALLDPRIQHPRYGIVFLDSLPPYTITSHIGKVREFFQPVAMTA